MKLKITLLLAVVSTASIFSQSGAKWATGGNSSSAGDFFGTTNNFPIDFKTNNVSRMNLSTTGILKLNNLAGTGSRLLQTDANGNIIFLPAGLSNQVLYGNGTWGPLPVIPSTVWQTNSFGTYYGGNVGIGLSNPQFALDVIGDAKISNNLIVGGGLIISQKVEATNSLKTDTVHSMTGETKFTSKVILKQQFQVDGTSLFNGTVQAGNLYVSGATNFANGANVNGTLNTSNLNVANNTTFVGGIIAPSINIGTSASPFNITTSSAANGAMVGSLGLIGPITFPPATCLSPPVAGDFYTQRLSIVKPTAVTSTNLLDFRNDGTNGYIDYGFDNTIYVAVVFDPITGLPITPATPPAPVLKINGACFGDVEIAKGGGVVSTGRNLEIGNPTRNYGIASNIKAGGAGIGQRITANSPYPDNNTSLPTTYNSQFFVNKNLTHVLSVFNTITNTTGDEVFTVYGNGKTQIGIGKPKVGGVAENAMLSVDGLILAKEIRVAVSTTTHWADYVFNENYKLMSLKELENFVKQNKHLPEVPSAENVVKEGIDVNEISATLLKKIEELTLYTIELQKQLEKQQQEINLLKK